MTDASRTLGASKAFQRSIEYLGSHVWTGEHFCHYTDLAGLKGILETNGLWLSDHRFLNDSSEHTYGQDLAIKIIGEILRQEDNVKFSAVLESVSLELSNLSEIFYVASFSLAQDRLDQWKGYSRTNEGVCLVLKNDFELGRDGVLTRLPAIEPLFVIYDQEEQVRRLRAMVSIFREEFVNNPCDVSDAFSLWEKDLSFCMGYQLIRFKHPEYASEEEVRLVVSSRSLSLAKRTPEHRVSNGRIIPYVTTRNPLLPSDTKLPLVKMIVGPLATQDSVIRSIEVFLGNLGYEHVVVHGSSVPFRG